MYENTKDLEWSKQSWERKLELEESGYPTSECSTKRHSSKQYGIGTIIEILKLGRNFRAKPMTYGHLIYEKEARYTMEKRQSLQ